MVIITFYHKLLFNNNILLITLSPPPPPLHPRLVLDALKQVDEERKAFRLVGGVLIEQKVKDVIPDLQTNIEKVIE